MSLHYTLCFLFVMQSQVQWIRFCNTLFNICFTKLTSCFVHKSPISLACVYLPQMLNFHLLNEWTNSNLFRHNYLCSLISYCCFLHFTKSILFVLEPSFFCIWCSCLHFHGWCSTTFKSHWQCQFSVYFVSMVMMNFSLFLAAWSLLSIYSHLSMQPN